MKKSTLAMAEGQLIWLEVCRLTDEGRRSDFWANCCAPKLSDQAEHRQPAECNQVTALFMDSLDNRLFIARVVFHSQQRPGRNTSVASKGTAKVIVGESCLPLINIPLSECATTRCPAQPAAGFLYLERSQAKDPFESFEIRILQCDCRATAPRLRRCRRPTVRARCGECRISIHALRVICSRSYEGRNPVQIEEPDA